ncbi:hypothetical protein Pmani_024141 [Petrolisthes manimaculis]|uniref:Uncharacterized protein n=1 Tax=Petrolisthes manimaculis TaxID=1843537 RepID=A0AAE1U0C1_9EUCA|nr:hypothetical protein Pmani_024141 [Petrolisthes manimaculis]
MKDTATTYFEFMTEKFKRFDQWLKKAEVVTFEELRKLVVLEEFIRRVPFEVKIHIADKEETDPIKVAKLADKYSLLNQWNPNRPRNQFNSSANNTSRFCSFCKKEGHTMRNCRNPKNRYSPINSRNVFEEYRNSKDNVEPPRKPMAHIVNVDFEDDPFAAFKTCGTIALTSNSPKAQAEDYCDKASNNSLVDFGSQSLSKENLIAAQTQDETLKFCRSQAVSTLQDVVKIPGFYYEDGVLMRLYRSPRLSSAGVWANITQIFPRSVPTSTMKSSSSLVRISPRKTELMRQEVDYLLQNQLAIPSCSPWASPSILVPKEGGRPLPKPSLPRSLIFWGEVLRPYNTR